jgi:hypothetical protein
MMRERAVSDVIGFILVFSLVSTTVAVVSISGFQTLEDARDAEKINNAERAFDVLDDNIEDITQDGAPSRATEISLTRSGLDTAGNATITITYNSTIRNSYNNSFQKRIDPLTWETNGPSETEIVYAFGAVIRQQRDGGVVVGRPPFELDDERMFLPVVYTFSDELQSYGGSVVRVRAEGTTSAPINVTTEPVYDDIRINITSPRYEIWEQYFSRQSAVESCTTYDDIQRVECNLVTPDELYVTVHGVELEIEG